MGVIFSHEYFMNLALNEAKLALAKDEVPIGAIVVSNNKIIGKAHNLTQTLNDVTAHAEMQVITSAANYLGGKYLHNCTLYVTLEPCPMCAAALYWTQIDTIVFGATDSKRGYKKEKTKLHPKTKVIEGIKSEECSMILSDFFVKKRKKPNL
jgi:tRNA(adenine34) deaminase